MSPTLLAWRNAEVQPSMRRGILFLSKVRLWHLLVALAVGGLCVVVSTAFRCERRPLALGFSMLTTGFAGMAVEMVVILSFQSLYGYLYQWIGLLIAMFMGGVALGAWISTRGRVAETHLCGTVVALEVSLTSVLFLAAVVLPAGQQFLPPGEGAFGWVPKLILLSLNLAGGTLVGCEFPLFTRLALREPGASVASMAGRFYALDLAGAWLGTVLGSLLLIPFLGVTGTFLVVGAMKGVAMICLLVSLR